MKQSILIFWPKLRNCAPRIDRPALTGEHVDGCVLAQCVHILLLPFFSLSEIQWETRSGKGPWKRVVRVGAHATQEVDHAGVHALFTWTPAAIFTSHSIAMALDTAGYIQYCYSTQTSVWRNFYRPHN